MANAGIAIFLIRPRAFGRDKLQHGAVRSARKIIILVVVIDPETEMIDVPLRQLLWIRSRDGGVFQSQEHKCDSNRLRRLSVDLKAKDAVRSVRRERVLAVFERLRGLHAIKTPVQLGHHQPQGPRSSPRALLRHGYLAMTA